MTRVRWAVAGPALAMALAVGVAVMLTLARDEPERGPEDDQAPVEVTSDAPRLATLDELVAASDVVVRGSVVRTERGRLFGDPGSAAAIESRLVTLEVAEVLAGPPPPGATILLEDEGWTADGAPLVVDGAAPSAIGDDGIWFLTSVEGPAGPAYVVVSAQGRYLVHGDGLRGARGDDPVVTELSALSAGELAAATRAQKQ